MTRVPRRVVNIQRRFDFTVKSTVCVSSCYLVMNPSNWVMNEFFVLYLWEMEPTFSSMYSFSMEAIQQQDSHLGLGAEASSSHRCGSLSEFLEGGFFFLGLLDFWTEEKLYRVHRLVFSGEEKTACRGGNVPGHWSFRVQKCGALCHSYSF